MSLDVAALVASVEGLESRLRTGARVAELDCDDGAATIELAILFPASVFCGFDPGLRCVAAARRAAAAVGVSDRVTFEVARSSDFPGVGYDLICQFRAGAVEARDGTGRRVRRALAPGGVWIQLGLAADQKR